MPIIHKSQPDFPLESFVTVSNQKYQSDYVIKFEVDNDIINLDNCICVFSILCRHDLGIRQYVGAKYYRKLTNDNVVERINGYLPEFAFCFTDTDFPLEIFLKEQNLI